MICRWFVDSDYLEVDTSPEFSVHKELKKKIDETSIITDCCANSSDELGSPPSRRRAHCHSKTSVDLPLDRTASSVISADSAASGASTHGRRLYDFEALSVAASYCRKTSFRNNSDDNTNISTSSNSNSCILDKGSEAYSHPNDCKGNKVAIEALLSMTHADL
jgi:hypothetical protein